MIGIYLIIFIIILTGIMFWRIVDSIFNNDIDYFQKY